MSHDEKQWGAEWENWATTGGDESEAFRILVEQELNKDRNPANQLDASEPAPEISADAHRGEKEHDADLEDTISLDTPVNVENVTATPKHAISRRAGAAALAIALLGGVGALGGASMWKDHAQRSAQSSCIEASEKYRQSLVREAKALKSWQALGTEQDDDAQTIGGAAKAAAKAAKPNTAKTSCPAVDRRELSADADRLNNAANSNNNNADVLGKTIADIHKQRTARLLARSRSGLTDKQNEAENLYASSAGNVSDETTRAGLKTTLDKTQNLLAKGSTAEAMDAQTAALDSAMNAVNASIQDKSNAEQANRQSQETTPAPSQTPAPSKPATPSIPKTQTSTKPQTPVPHKQQSNPIPPLSPAPAAPSQPQSGGNGWYVPPAGNGDSGLPNHL